MTHEEFVRTSIEKQSYCMVFYRHCSDCRCFFVHETGADGRSGIYGAANGRYGRLARGYSPADAGPSNRQN